MLPLNKQHGAGREPGDALVEGTMGDLQGADVLGERDVVRERSDGNIVSGSVGASRAPGAETNYEVIDWVTIFTKVVATGKYNYQGARIPVPSGLRVEAWKECLRGYHDYGVVEFLNYGWPANCEKGAIMIPTWQNHPLAERAAQDIEHYIRTEKGHAAIVGPFRDIPFTSMQVSPLMTRLKRDSEHRRVIMGLSWPHGAAVNDHISSDIYVDGPARIRLPTVEYMEGRLREFGQGAYLYKTDLARGYRQLRIDPNDWSLLGFQYQGEFYFDLCPPFGLRSSALCMQRTSEAISWIHAQRGFMSRPYLDDFGGAERTFEEAERALGTLQAIMAELGVKEAAHKVCHPAQRMVWLGLWYDSVAMTISIPALKLAEIMDILEAWRGKMDATQREMQQLLGLLQFVAGVSPPTRIFTNRMLENLREMPRRGRESLSLGFKCDLAFFLDLLPHYNGVRIIVKKDIAAQRVLELDSCLSGCGAFVGDSFYAEEFPREITREQHNIARLELLNIVIAIKVWCERWQGQAVHVHCDNMNACLAVRSGRSRDPFMQHCIRELFVYQARYDIEVHAEHTPGKTLLRADALSRMHMDNRCRQFVRNDVTLSRARRVRVPVESFRLLSVL